MHIVDLFEITLPQKPDTQKETMYVEDESPQLVVVFPGRFQPFHLGHAEVFQSLQNKFGRDHVYIVTSNKTELPKSPFSFTDKTVFMTAAGVPADRIIEVQSPYLLPKQFDPTNTIFIVAVGAPDADRLKPGSTRKDGSPSYYQTFSDIGKCSTADKHGYVIIAAERRKIITINGQQVDVSHGTQSRAAWNNVRNDPSARSEYLTQMFGRDDSEIGRIMDKIPMSGSVTEGKSAYVGPDQQRFNDIKFLYTAFNGAAGVRRARALANINSLNATPKEKRLLYKYTDKSGVVLPAGEVSEDSNMPVAVDSISPIHGESRTGQRNTRGPKALDPEELDRLMTSVGKKAKQGPMKTIWDPKIRKYRVVPVSEAAEFILGRIEQLKESMLELKGK